MRKPNKVVQFRSNHKLAQKNLTRHTMILRNSKNKLHCKMYYESLIKLPKPTTPQKSAAPKNERPQYVMQNFLAFSLKQWQVNYSQNSAVVGWDSILRNPPVF